MNEMQSKLHRQIARDSDLSLSLCFILFSFYVSSYVFVTDITRRLTQFLLIILSISLILGLFLLIKTLILRRRFESYLTIKIKVVLQLIDCVFALLHIILFLVFTCSPAWFNKDNNLIFDFSYSYIENIFFGLHFIYAILVKLYISSFINKKSSAEISAEVELVISNFNRMSSRNYSFGNKLCFLREKLGLKQTDVAKKLKISDKTISKWENGVCYPRKKHMRKLSNLYGEDITKFITREEMEG